MSHYLIMGYIEGHYDVLFHFDKNTDAEAETFFEKLKELLQHPPVKYDDIHLLKELRTSYTKHR